VNEDEVADHELPLLLERARRALRRGHPAEAAALLAPCGDDPRRTYAREWASRRSTLSYSALQSVLAWLCADEAEHARRAVEAGDFSAAAEFWHNALRLDRRFTRAALARARALREACRAEHRPRSARALAASWSDSVGFLATAEQLAGRARDEDRLLAAEATALLGEIRAERGRAVKLAAFWRCYAQVESFGEHYRRVRPRNWLDYSNIRTSFVPIAGDVDRLIRRYGRDDPDIGRLLGELAELVETARAQLR
jgi:Arc/MetJ-type ribon-helix-helix transcriptional regulator